MRKLWIGLTVIALVAAGMMLVARGTAPEWTTSSHEALAEFELGLDSLMKLYVPEAREHFQKALELDPEFAAAKLFLLEMSTSDEDKKGLNAELRATDLDRLTPRERYLITSHLAYLDHEIERAKKLGQDFLGDHPEDPFALSTCFTLAWEEGDWERAEQHSRRLLEVNPNWVIAQNVLGYMAMAQGRFAESEELLKTYKYIAPDQANPHDSLGELLTLLGRYHEARLELEQALEIKPDFCVSYRHLFDLAVLEGRPDETEAIASRAEEHCGEEDAFFLRCGAFLWSAFINGDYEAPWRGERPECLKVMESPNFLSLQFLIRSGRTEEARAMEETLLTKIEEQPSRAPHRPSRGLLSHAQGVRLALDGDFDQAVEQFRAADSVLAYWGEGGGVMKLYNRLHLAGALERIGDQSGAESVLAEVREVNPSFAEIYKSVKATFAGG